MGTENVLKYIELITLLLPLIESLVSMVERIFERGGKSEAQGPIKKDAVIELLTASGATKGLPRDVVSGLIDGVVAAKNWGGEFAHTI